MGHVGLPVLYGSPFVLPTNLFDIRGMSAMRKNKQIPHTILSHPNNMYVIILGVQGRLRSQSIYRKPSAYAFCHVKLGINQMIRDMTFISTHTALYTQSIFIHVSSWKRTKTVSSVRVKPPAGHLTCFLLQRTLHTVQYSNDYAWGKQHSS